MLNKQIEVDNEISFNDILTKILSIVSLAKKYWVILLFFGLLGGLLGYLYAASKPTFYTAKISFVLEEGKSTSSGLGGLASLAGQFGVDVGSSGGGNVLSGDNILIYFRSFSLAKDVLLTSLDSSNTKTLADFYIEVYNLKNDWNKLSNTGVINFNDNTNASLNDRLKDSLLQIIFGNITQTQFSIQRPDKKAGFLEVSTTMINENLSKLYCERIVKLAVENYVNSKTQRQKNTVDKLQKRVDSVSNLLFKKTVSGASLQNKTTTMDINPLFKTQNTIDYEITTRDKSMLSSIFMTASQNLEMAKFTLSQETPVIQIVDKPVMPLSKNKISKLRTSILWAILFQALCFALIFSNNFIKTKRNQSRLDINKRF